MYPVMQPNSKALDTFPGARYWRSMQGSVDAILTPLGIKRRVLSMGTQFVNYDKWTAEAFAHHLCDWMSKNARRLPTDTELRDLISQANSTRCRDPHIRVARMPERVTHRLALGIVGGGYHEAWHTKYSKRDRVRKDEVTPIMDVAEQVILAGGQFDAKMRGLLMTLHHLIEDIRIERRGNEDFEGARQAMCDLQDFILDLEHKARAKGAKVKNVTVTSNARSIMLCAFRDLGLGYNTHLARQTIEFYKQTAPGAVAMLADGGLLHPMLHEAKNLSRQDGMGSLRVAMKIVVELWRAMQDDSEQPDCDMTCPSCGAGAKELIIRSVKNADGVKVKGVAELECKACGYKTQFPLPDNSLNLNQQQKEQEEPEEKPEVEDLDQEDVGEGGDGFGDDQREDMRDKMNDPENQETQESQEQQSEDGDDGDEGDAVDAPTSGDEGEDSDDAEGEDEGEDDAEGASGGSSEDSEEDSEDAKGASGSDSDSDDGDESGDDEDDRETRGASGDKDSEDDEGSEDAAEGDDDSAEGDEGDDEEGEDSGDGDGDQDWDFEDLDGLDKAEEGDDEWDDEDGDDEDEDGLNDDVWDELDDDGAEDGDGDDRESSDDGAEDGDAGNDKGDGDEEGDGDDRESSDGGDSLDGDSDPQTGGDEASEADDDWEMDGEDFLNGAGGENFDIGRDPRSSLHDAEAVMGGDEKDGVMTNQDAIEQGLAEQDQKDQKDRKGGEMIWNPYNAMLDEARLVRSNDQAEDLKLANLMLQEARQTVTFLRARLRTIVKAQEMTDTVHGVRRGRKMSQRMLVDTAVDLKSGRMPSRAYQTTDAQLDTSMALSICLDQSSSMHGMRREVAKCMMVMADSIEGIQGKTFAFGFRNGDRGDYSGGYNWSNTYHRVRGVRYDVFKTWDEGFANTKWRFAHTQAQGTTPMADGVQFGISSLNDRREAHRVLAIITDGCPDSPHEKVIRRQIRIAREGGIHVIGIGIGYGAEYVTELFGADNAVWAESVEALPDPLLRKLNDLCDFSGRFRGRRAKLDGKITRKVS